MASTAPSTPSRASRPPPVDWSKADAAFRKFFRLPPEGPIDGPQSLDSLSRLACKRQGLLPEELLPSPPTALLPPRLHIPPTAKGKITSAVEEKEAKRREAKFDIVEEERKHLHEAIISAAHMQRLTHELDKVRTELLAQCDDSTDGDLRCADEEEAEDMRILLHHGHTLAPEREKLQKMVEQTRTKGAEEVKKLRRRHLHMVAHDMSLEAQRREMLKAIEERDAVFRSMKAHREEQLTQQAKKEARVHRRKIRTLQLRNAVIAEHRAAELQERTAAQEELWQQLVKQREAELEKRRLESQHKDEIARDRADAVKTATIRHCEDLERQLLDKAITHEERRETIRLQLEVAREQRRLATLRKFYAAKQYVETNADDGSEILKDVQERETEASIRRNASIERQKKYFQQRQQTRAARYQQVEAKRAAAEEAKARRDLELLQREYEKEQNVERARREAEEQRVLRVAVFEVKRSHHTDNLARIERQQQHKQMQKEALLREANERDRAKQQLREEMTKKLQAARQRLAEDRERVQLQVTKLRDSKDILSQSPQDVLEASLKRDRPATSPARIPARGKSPEKGPAPTPTAPTQHHQNPTPPQATSSQPTTPSAAVHQAAAS